MKKPTILLVLSLLLLPQAAAQGQTVRTPGVMRSKLAHTQRILEALMTSNYSVLERESAALSRLTETPEWSELKTSELLGFTKSFLAATQALAESARQRDLDGAARHYVEMTTACYECHKYRKGSRIAR